MGGKHSQRLLTPLHYCANGMIVAPRWVARSLDLSVCAHLPGERTWPIARRWRRSLADESDGLSEKTSTYSETFNKKGGEGRGGLL